MVHIVNKPNAFGFGILVKGNGVAVGDVEYPSGDFSLKDSYDSFVFLSFTTSIVMVHH